MKNRQNNFLDRIRLLLMILAGTAFLPSIGIAQEAVPIEFELRRVGRVEVISLQRDRDVYLPMQRVFDFLRIKHEYNPATGVLSGFYLSEDSLYRIEARTGAARVGPRTVRLAPDDLIATSEDLYLRVERFETVFGLPVEYNPRRLAARLITNLPLPIFLDRRLARMEQRLAMRPARLEHEAHYARTPAFLDGARLDWSLRQALSTTRAPVRTFSTRFSAHVLGGDVDVRTMGRISPAAELTQTRGRWRFVPPDDTFFEQLVLGDVIGSGLISRHVFGGEITNRPPYRRTIFTEGDFFGRFPDTERNVYLYRDARLTSVAPPTQEGSYQFTAPLRYGVNLIDIRTYSPWGELYQHSYRVFIPPEMVPPGEVQYSVLGGKIRDDDWPWYGDVSLDWGAHSRLTVGGRMEYYEDVGGPTNVFPSLTGIVRLTEHLVGDGLVSPNAMFRGNLSLTLPSLVGGTFGHTKFRPVGLFNPRRAINETRGSVVLPASIDGLRVALTVTGQQTILQADRERTLRSTLSMLVGGFSPRFSTNAGWIHSYGTNGTRLAFWQSEASLRIRMPANLFFTVGFRYDHPSERLLDMRTNVVLRPVSKLSLEVNYNRSFVVHSSLISVRLQYLFPYFRATATTTRTAAGVRYNQTVNGSLSFSPPTGRFFFDYYTSRAGYGSIFVLPFHDQNNNGVRDPGEEIIHTARIRASTVREGHGAFLSWMPGVGWGTMRALPYQSYSIEVERRGFENPLWIPLYSSFTVTAEPSRFTLIELPVVSGGIVRGRVTLAGEAGARVALERIRVRISEIPTSTNEAGLRQIPFEQVVETFSTGDYEFLAVPPGEYDVSLDPVQVNGLGLTGRVLVRRVTVQPKPDGDFVEGIDFVLEYRNNRR